MSGDSSRIDAARISHALGACDFLLQHLDDQGDYHHPEQWGPEGNLYRIEIASVLLEAWRICRDERYLHGADRILDRFRASQRSDGHWTLGLYGQGLEYRVERKYVKEAEGEDCAFPWVTAEVLVVARKKAQLTGTETEPFVSRAIEALVQELARGSGLLDVDLHGWNLQMARVACLLAAASWKDAEPRLQGPCQRLQRWLLHLVPELGPETQPFTSFMAAYGLLSAAPSHAATEEVKCLIERYRSGNPYRCQEIRGGYGHRDTARGLVNDEANIRGTGAFALLYRTWDLYADRPQFTRTDEYRDMCAWIDSMRAGDGGYYEYQKARDGIRRGRGSPAHYVPCWWIFGTF